MPPGWRQASCRVYSLSTSELAPRARDSFRGQSVSPVDTFLGMTDQDTTDVDVSASSESSPLQPIRIVLADDHAVVRSGLRLLLDSEQDFEVVAEASNVESARRYVRGHHPKVLVLDLNMPGGSSLEAIPTLRKESPDSWHCRAAHQLCDSLSGQRQMLRRPARRLWTFARSSGSGWSFTRVTLVIHVRASVVGLAPLP
jgi:CheY-like chemotaxis protein